MPVGQPSTMYVGPASGNVWKTTNAGLTWQPVFDQESAFAAGDIAVAPSNPNIVWVGTGEAQPRHSGVTQGSAGRQEPLAGVTSPHGVPITGASSRGLAGETRVCGRALRAP